MNRREPVFDRIFDPEHGRAVEIVPGVRRLTARNVGGYTFTGTNSYLFGTAELVVVDPGPDRDDHVADLIAAIGGRPVEAILITHTHRDHSPAARALSAATGAPVIGAGRHRFARELHEGEATSLDASADLDHVPDRELVDGEVLETAAGAFVTIATPGHTGNHLCFHHIGSGLLISGDHVMGWSTSIVAPPDGSMADYMASLDRLIALEADTYLPGHGGIVRDARSFSALLRVHREDREAAVLAAIEAGTEEIPAIVARVYRGLDPKLKGAAALSVFAQVEWLAEKGAIVTDGAPQLGGRFRPAR